MLIFLASTKSRRVEDIEIDTEELTIPQKIRRFLAKDDEDTTLFSSKASHRHLIWIPYVFGQIILLFCIWLTVSHAVKISSYTQNINSDRLYSIKSTYGQVYDLELRCVGDGNTTVLIEGELGATIDMYMPYLPSHLAVNGTKVTFYNTLFNIHTGNRYIRLD